MKNRINNLIASGHYSITLPILIIYAISYLILGMNILVLGLTTLVAWRYWSITVPKWKLKSLRSLESTAQYLEWNSKAIWNGLIWSKHCVINNSEIWSADDLSEYQRLRNKFINADAHRNA